MLIQASDSPGISRRSNAKGFGGALLSGHMNPHRKKIPTKDQLIRKLIIVIYHEQETANTTKKIRVSGLGIIELQFEKENTK